MTVSPLTIAGLVLFFVGALLFGSQVFGHGGWAKSAQFRVVGELMRGTHGTRARRLMLLAFVMLPIGSCLLFAAVGSSDRERRHRCDEHCEAAGYATARIGPNSDRDSSDRSTWFVACICEGGEGGRLELEANGLLEAR